MSPSQKLMLARSGQVVGGLLAIVAGVWSVWPLAIVAGVVLGASYAMLPVFNGKETNE